ncbi:MAG: hypothetical protein JOZ38_03455 [Candidatus Eremiobacteraeota bacterium]|nr:hypothetical protein [Candidatus Eremiobacteraeota bacterium]
MRWISIFLTCALAFSAPQPGVASDASDLQAKIRSALRDAKSFQITVHQKGMPAGAMLVATVVAPNRYRQTVSGLGPPNDDDTIIIGSQVYGIHGKGWGVQTWDRQLVDGFESNAFLPDVVSAAGNTFVMRYPHEFEPKERLNCTYDPQTYRPQSCQGPTFSLQYARYDDPTLEIPTPVGAKKLD